MSARRRARAAKTQSTGEEKREAILAAALALFSRYGFRKTSIDEIAREVGIAKGTVYLYFATKEDIFRAVCESLTGRVLRDAEAAAAAKGVRIGERLHRMIEVKYRTFFESVHRSPHAGELIDSRNRLSGDLFARFDRAYVDLLAAAITRAVRRGELKPPRLVLEAGAAADLLACAARGIEVESAGPEAAKEFAPRLRRLVQVVVTALGGETE